MKQLTLCDRHDAELHGWNREEQCPSCGGVGYVVPDGNEDLYVDDEDLLRTQYGSQWIPYKAYICRSCDCELRVYLGAVKVEVIKEGRE